MGFDAVFVAVLADAFGLLATTYSLPVLSADDPRPPFLVCIIAGAGVVAKCRLTLRSLAQARFVFGASHAYPAVRPIP